MGAQGAAIATALSQWANCLLMLLMLRPSQSAQVLTGLMGISLLAEGLLSLCVALCAIKVVKKPSDAR